MIYDVNGRKKPNKVGEDIVTLNARVAAGFDCVTPPGASICIATSSLPYSPTDEPCVADDGVNYCADSKNYWAGARDACRAAGGRLPTLSEMHTKVISDYLKANTTDVLWLINEGGSNLAYFWFSDFGSANANGKQWVGYSARCVR